MNALAGELGRKGTHEFLVLFLRCHRAALERGPVDEAQGQAMGKRSGVGNGIDRPEGVQRRRVLKHG